MHKELKKAIVTWLAENENAWHRVNQCKTVFRSYIYDADGNYLIGGEDVSDFISAADKLLYQHNEPVSKENPKKTVIYYPYEEEILIGEIYSDGSIKGEFVIINTEYGFALKAYHDAWSVLEDCSDLIKLLGSNSMGGVTMKELAYNIEAIGYKLDIR